ncbi:MAG TPA: tetratricopeptide repeat protein, partial [Cyclobacteriaceae bacterium]|nr:tetratricopeptide repeat protein [Cyclobacteriaceae bacterium]
MRLASSLCILFVLFSFVTKGQEQLSAGKTERLFKKGTELVSHSNFGAAREVFSVFLKQASPTDSRRADAEYYIAYCAVSLGHSDGEKLIEDFIASNPSNPRSATAYYDLANFFYEDKEFTKASSYYGKVNFAGLGQEEQTVGHFKWGYSYFNLKKLDEALVQFNSVKIQTSQYSPAANYYAGFIEYSKGEYDNALVDLKKAEANTSYSTIVPSLITSVYYKQKKYDELIKYAGTLQPRADKISNYDEISMLVADAYYFKKDYKNAVTAYESYLEDNEAKAPGGLLFRAGYSYYALDQDEKATQYLKTSAAKQDSVSFYASYYLGILYLKQGNKQFALNSFAHSRNCKNDEKLVEESTFQHAKVSYDLGKGDLAIPQFEKFLVTYPKSSRTVEVKELLAQSYVDGNNYNKAIEYIESLPQRGASMDKAYQKATYLKGAELFNKEDYAEAVKSFEKSLTSSSDQKYVALASFWCAEAFSIGRKYEEALPHYKKVIALGASVDAELFNKTRYGLGYCHYNLQQYPEALFNFKEFVNRAAKGQSNLSDGVLRLADCYYVSKSYPEAITQYNRARQLNSPDDDYIIFQTGVINGVLRKYEEARNQFALLIKNYPKSQYRDEAIFQRAQFEIEQGNYQTAADGFSQLINENTSTRFLPYAYMRRAASFYNLKQYDKTINDYRAVLTQFPTHPVAQQVLLPLQEVLGIAGRGAEFETYLAEFKKANPGNKDLEVVEFESAKNLYFDQQYQKAITSFTAFSNTYPESAKIPDVKYYTAESHFRLSVLDKALLIYTELSNDPTFSLWNKVIGRIAEIQFKQGKYDQAIVSFHRVEKIAASKKEFYTAWSGLMESFFLLAKYDSVDAYANMIIQKGNVNAGAQNKASLYLGKSAMARGDYETAKDEFLNTLNTARDEYGAEAKYRIGEIFYLTKEYKQC